MEVRQCQAIDRYVGQGMMVQHLKLRLPQDLPNGAARPEFRGGRRAAAPMRESISDEIRERKFAVEPAHKYIRHDVPPTTPLKIKPCEKWN